MGEFTPDGPFKVPLPLPKPFSEMTEEEKRKLDSGTTKGYKMDAGKLRFELLPTAPLREIVKVFTYGAAKYTDDNWRQGMKWRRVYGAVQRHLNAFWGGEDIDPESGIHHLAHAAFGLLTLMEYGKTHPEHDDRVKENK